MHPAIALALLATAGLLATRLPAFWVVRDHPDATGLLLILAGVALGPVARVLDTSTLRALTPGLALLVGWCGAELGTGIVVLPRFSAPVERRRALYAASVALAVNALITILVWVLARRIAPLGTLWIPIAAVALTLSAALAAPDIRPGPMRRATVVEWSVSGALALIALALVRPHAQAVSRFGAMGWLVVGMVSAVALGFCLRALRGRIRTEYEATLGLMALVGLGAGIGVATGLSPFVVCALFAAVATHTSDPLSRRTLRRELTAGAQVASPFVLVALGAFVSFDTWWMVPAVLAIAALRLALWLGLARWKRSRRFAVPPPSELGAALLAVNYILCTDAQPGSRGAVALCAAAAVLSSRYSIRSVDSQPASDRA